MGTTGLELLHYEAGNGCLYPVISHLLGRK